MAEEDQVITPAYVSILTEEVEGKTIYHIRQKDQDKGLERRLLKTVQDPTKIVFIYSEEGPVENYTPLFDLVMREVNEGSNEPAETESEVNGTVIVIKNLVKDPKALKALSYTYKNHVTYEFSLSDGSVIYCKTGIRRDGSLAPSSIFYKQDMSNDDPFRALFWLDEYIDSPEIAEYFFTENIAKVLGIEEVGDILVENKVDKPKKGKKRKENEQKVINNDK